MNNLCFYSGLPYCCELCTEETAPCSYHTMYCKKLKKFCIARNTCDEVMMKKLGCFEKLKEQNLFENQE